MKHVETHIGLPPSNILSAPVKYTFGSALWQGDKDFFGNRESIPIVSSSDSKCKNIPSASSWWHCTLRWQSHRSESSNPQRNSCPCTWSFSDIFGIKHVYNVVLFIDWEIKSCSQNAVAIYSYIISEETTSLSDSPQYKLRAMRSGDTDIVDDGTNQIPISIILYKF